LRILARGYCGFRQLWTKGYGFHRRSLNLLSGSGLIDGFRPTEGVRKQGEVGCLTGEPYSPASRCNRSLLCQKFCAFRQNQFIELLSLIPERSRQPTPLDPDTPLPCRAVSGLRRFLIKGPDEGAWTAEEWAWCGSRCEALRAGGLELGLA